VRKKYLAVIGFAVAVLLTPLAIVAGASAVGFRGGDMITVAKSEKVDGTLFAAGQTVEVAGEVNGDVFCAGNSITITGTVHGDIICAGQTVNIRGTVDGDIRVAGQSVTIEAKVAGNISAAGQSVTLQSDSQAHDVQAAGSTVTLNGVVSRDASFAGSVLSINGMVGRNVNASADQLSLGTNAKVAGNVDYKSHSKLAQASGATVGGKVHQDVPKEDHKNKDSVKNFLSGINWFFAISGLLTSLLIVALVPRVLYSVTSHGVNQPGMTLLAGLGTNVGAGILIILLGMTFIGIPLAGFVLLAWALLGLLSLPVFSFYLGRVLLSNSTDNVFYYMLLGAGIVFLLNFIPILGAIVLFLGSLFGVGMLALRISRHWTVPRYTIKQGKKA